MSIRFINHAYALKHQELEDPNYKPVARTQQKLTYGKTYIKIGVTIENHKRLWRISQIFKAFIATLCGITIIPCLFENYRQFIKSSWKQSLTGKEFIQVYALKNLLNLSNDKTSGSDKSYKAIDDISMEKYQQFVYYLDNLDFKNSKKILDSITNLNAYFSHSDQTPLTLAIRKGNFNMTQYLLDKKVSPNQSDRKENSPLLLAAMQDLPRKFFIKLFEAGAKPQSEKEVKQIEKAAQHQHLIKAIHSIAEGKPYNWPDPQNS